MCVIDRQHTQRSKSARARERIAVSHLLAQRLNLLLRQWLALQQLLDPSIDLVELAHLGSVVCDARTPEEERDATLREGEEQRREDERSKAHDRPTSLSVWFFTCVKRGTSGARPDFLVDFSRPRSVDRVIDPQTRGSSAGFALICSLARLVLVLVLVVYARSEHRSTRV